MNLYEDLVQYQEQLIGHKIGAKLVISEELKAVRLPIDQERKIEIFDLLIIYFSRKFEGQKMIQLNFNLEVKKGKCIIIIKPQTNYKADASVVHQEFFWTMHLIFNNLLKTKETKIWGNFVKDKFRLQLPLWCMAA
tara:strand:+ start:61263 stop:61670 length:408 start_codon:yes stop_codon:yes gene_type:complete